MERMPPTENKQAGPSRRTASAKSKQHAAAKQAARKYTASKPAAKKSAAAAKPKPSAGTAKQSRAKQKPAANKSAAASKRKAEPGDQPQKDTGNLPAPIAALAQNPRVTIRRPGEPARDGKCVLLWLQRAQRAIDNPALDIAVHLANELGLPVVAFFSAISNFPHANLRHYYFLNQGLRDLEEDLASSNVTLVVRRPPHNALEKLAVELDAAIIIGDENPMREPERWRQLLVDRIDIPYWTVDADVIVPSNIWTKAFTAERFFRPKLYAEMGRFLHDADDKPHAKHAWKRPAHFESFNVHEDMTAGWRNFDRSVTPVEEWTGGTHAALKLLDTFVKHKLADYDTVRNHPERDGTSRLSPALHFGHIGPLTITKAIEAAVARGETTKEARDAYYGEVLGWRELCVNHVRTEPNYDNIDGSPHWAQETLKKHAKDKRDPLYTREQMERGETYDDMWNAAQTQMVRFGWMHNFLRMYWAKKILEWSPSAAEAFDTTVYLNDKYFLDGRDPNGYAGIAWAVSGLFDRPWPEHPIFGKIRYQSRASTGKKFNLKRYIANVEEGRAFGD
jgi:deoxyribodipyrimidine photo-lyase